MGRSRPPRRCSVKGVCARSVTMSRGCMSISCFRFKSRQIRNAHRRQAGVPIVHQDVRRAPAPQSAMPRAPSLATRCVNATARAGSRLCVKRTLTPTPPHHRAGERHTYIYTPHRVGTMFRVVALRSIPPPGHSPPCVWRSTTTIILQSVLHIYHPPKSNNRCACRSAMVVVWGPQ